mgnify:CR=1 FL=1
MQYEKKIPKKGQRLIHRFKDKNEAVAKIISVDEKTGKVAVKVDGITYPTLSTAGKAVSGYSTNGWVFWGLKKQAPKSNKTGAH